MENHVITVRADSYGTTLTQVTARQHTFFIDEPPLFHGKDEAPSPVEYLLGSVAGCITAIGCWMAQEAQFTIRRLSTTVDGVINSACFFGMPEATRSGFQNLQITLAIDCDATTEQLEAWKNQLMLRCPVLDGLLHPAEITIVCERNNT